jgi:glycosyltransferase involved in cell wall biosynthesis
VNIVVMSTFYEVGGAELQAKWEFEYLLSQGKKVQLWTFDPALSTGESLCENHINIMGNYSTMYRRAHDNIDSSRLKKLLMMQAKKFKPDVIHLHQIGFAFGTVVKTFQDVLILQTIHDYSIVCDKGTCIKPNGEVCSDCSFVHCRKDCYSQSLKRKMKIYYRHQVMQRNYRLRKKYINQLISPSECLARYMRKAGYDVVCINNAISNKDFGKFRKKLPTDKKIVLYFGGICKAKGVYQLLEAYDAETNKEIELHFIGRIDNGKAEDNMSEEQFKTLVESKRVIYHGAMKHEEIIMFLQKVFAVIVPSFWMENYPTTAMEGALGECVVCGSDRGGVPELVLCDELLFDVSSVEEIKKTLKRINDMNTEEYENICRKQKEKFYLNNTPEIYFSKLFSLISSLKGVQE